MTDRRFLDAHMRTSYARAEAVGNLLIRAGRLYGWDSDDFVETAVDAVLAGQTAQASAAWETLAAIVTAADPLERELDVEPPIDVMIGAATHDGTPLETVYRRPGNLAAELAAEGLADAVISARIESETFLLADADMMTAGRKAEQVYGAVDRRVVGWRRVPNIGACRWCRYIATQRYKKQDLAPAHRGCHCGTEPILGTVDPGPVADPEELKRIKREGVPKRHGSRKASARRANQRIAKPDVELPTATDVRAPYRGLTSTDDVANLWAERHPGARFVPGKFELDEAIEFAEILEDLETRYPLLPGMAVDVGEINALYPASEVGRLGIGVLGMAQFPLTTLAGPDGAKRFIPSTTGKGNARLGTRKNWVSNGDGVAKAHSTNHFSTPGATATTVHEYGHLVGYSAEIELLNKLQDGTIAYPGKRRPLKPGDVSGRLWEEEVKRVIRETLPDSTVEVLKGGRYVETRIADLPKNAAFSKFTQAIRDGLSTYGSTNAREVMAEAFAEYELVGDAARPLSRAIVERALELTAEGTERIKGISR